MPSFKTDILILGAGIGGFETFRTLSRELKRTGINKKITIVDRNNYFTFVPLLHEVATGSVEPSHTTVPLRELVHGTPHDFIKADVIKILPETNTVQTSAGDITYDYCVVAIGSGVNFYGTPGAAENSATARTLPDAMRLRERLIGLMESCQQNVAISVVGGGFTGIEIASQLMDLARNDFKKLYPKQTVTVTLVQNVATLAPVLPVKAQKLIEERLNGMGVNILFNAKILRVEEKQLVLESGPVTSDLTIWSAGNQNDMALCMDPTYCEKGRLPVTPFLNHAKFSNLYGVGDIALAFNENETMPQPQLGEAAHKQGEYVGKHIARQLQHATQVPFKFTSAGTLMPVGDFYGLVILKNTMITGFFAWWIRRTVYLLFMPGFMRKLRIVVDWTIHLFGGFRYVIAIERRTK